MPGAKSNPSKPRPGGRDEDGARDTATTYLPAPSHFFGKGLFHFTPHSGQKMSEPGIVKTELIDFNVELRLESGRLLGPLTLAYETYGRLNSARSNAILVAHAWTGDAHAAGKHCHGRSQTRLVG